MIPGFKYQKCKNSGANPRNERLFLWKAFLHLLDSTVCSEKVCPNQKEKKRGNLGNIMFYQFELYCKIVDSFKTMVNGALQRALLTWAPLDDIG